MNFYLEEITFSGRYLDIVGPEVKEIIIGPGVKQYFLPGRIFVSR